MSWRSQFIIRVHWVLTYAITDCMRNFGFFFGIKMLLEILRSHGQLNEATPVKVSLTVINEF